DIMPGRGDNLNVEQGDKHPYAHHDERDDGAQKTLFGRGRGGHWLPALRVSTAAVMERPGVSRWLPSWPGSRRIRTGTRWTILVKLPVAFSGGITLNCAPVAGARLSIRPWKVWPGRTSA